MNWKAVEITVSGWQLQNISLHSCCR